MIPRQFRFIRLSSCSLKDVGYGLCGGRCFPVVDGHEAVGDDDGFGSAIVVPGKNRVTFLWLSMYVHDCAL